MSPSVRRAWLAMLTIIVAIIVLRSLVENEKPPQNDTTQQDNPVDIHSTDIPKRSAPRSPRSDGPHASTQPASTRTSGVTDLPATPPSLTPAVSGFIIDQFHHWQSIPPGYVADGVRLENGVITLIDASETSHPRDGILVSPVLPLHQPAMAAPVDQSVEMPEGSGIQLQVQLSEDGETWSPWLIVQRDAPPDGNRIAPAMQPMLANADLNRLDSQSSSSKAAQNRPGPRVRYRLGLSATGAAPKVSDLRIWKRTTY